MERVAVFVDAGYLFAQGSVAISGSKRARIDMSLDAPAALQELKILAESRAPDAKLLRVYWYDGTTGNRPSADQVKIAFLDDAKLRLGSINSAGQQKGVDSLIVTDLIELARLHAICDAVLVAGDEDVRPGVVIAQNYGVRIHLLGIAPTRGNQSPQLMQEADTTIEWGPEIVRRFLSLRAAPVIVDPTPAPVAAAPVAVAAATTETTGFDPRLELAVKDMVDALKPSDIEALAAYWKTSRGVPSEFDRRLLPLGRSAIGDDLDTDQKRFVRARFAAMARQRLGHPTG